MNIGKKIVLCYMEIPIIGSYKYQPFKPHSVSMNVFKRVDCYSKVMNIVAEIFKFWASTLTKLIV